MPDVLLRLEGEAIDLLAAKLLDDLGNDLGALDHRSAEGPAAVAAHKEHFGQLDGRVRVPLELLDDDTLPLFDTVLLAAGLHDRIHDYGPYPLRAIKGVRGRDKQINSGHAR